MGMGKPKISRIRWFTTILRTSPVWSAAGDISPFCWLKPWALIRIHRCAFTKARHCTTRSVWRSSPENMMCLWHVVTIQNIWRCLESPMLVYLMVFPCLSYMKMPLLYTFVSQSSIITIIHLSPPIESECSEFTLPGSIEIYQFTDLPNLSKFTMARRCPKSGVKP